jgi:nucleoside-diphosphate-sugar epimerase
MKKKILVCGGAGFIGHHLAKKLKNQGHYVCVADIKPTCDFSSDSSFCDLYWNLDLTKEGSWKILSSYDFDEVFQLAADMGGAGYIFTGENDANVMHNSALINLLCAEFCVKNKVKKVFYSSSACMYPAYNQEDPNNPNCKEDSAYPAAPDSEYGWEKLFSERLYLAFARNHGLNVRIARFHNIFGPEGTWIGGKEKAPAATCRKVLEAKDGGFVKVWGDGKQTRSFLYIDECLEGIERLMNSDFTGPVNLGSEEIITINDLTQMVIKFSGKDLKINNIPGPEGVRGRNSDNKLIFEKLGWKPELSLEEGMKKTYLWIEKQYNEMNKPEVSL